MARKAFLHLSDTQPNKSPYLEDNLAVALRTAGFRLRVKMALNGIRATHVAREVGLSTSTMSRILSGQVEPSEATVAKIEAVIHEAEGGPK